MIIKLSDLGEFAVGDDWACWTSAEEAAAQVAALCGGCITEDAVIYEDKNDGTIELLCEFDMGIFAHVNPRGQVYYKLPPMAAKLVLSEQLRSSHEGDYFWGEPESGQVYAHTAKGVLTLSLI